MRAIGCLKETLNIDFEDNDIDLKIIQGVEGGDRLGDENNTGEILFFHSGHGCSCSSSSS